MKTSFKVVLLLALVAGLWFYFHARPQGVETVNTSAAATEATHESSPEMSAVQEVELAVPTSSLPVVGVARVPKEQAPAAKVESKKTAPAATVTPERSFVAAPAAQKGNRLIIPSIGLNKAIGTVGLTSSGAMDVLDDPSRVSWYRGGAFPGQVGSAVIGAHVYQSFGNLKKMKVGDAIYVQKEDGSKLRFVVNEVAIYDYTDPRPLSKLFNRADAARLNLITCYGQLTAGGSTYTHRLVVYAQLAGTS